MENKLPTLLELQRKFEEGIALGLLQPSDANNIEIIDFSDTERVYAVVTHTDEGLLELEKELENETQLHDYVPSRKISITHRLDYTKCNFYKLTYLEAVKLRRDPRVKAVALEDNPYIEPVLDIVQTGNFDKPTSLATGTANQHTNYGLIRHSNATNVFGAGTDSPVDQYEYTHTGESIDVVVFDYAMQPNHEEWLGPDGVNRFECIDWWRVASGGLFYTIVNGAESSTSTVPSGVTNVTGLLFPNGTWSVAPTITISPPWQPGGTTAQFEFVLSSSGTITAARPINYGSGYAPKITVTGGGGSGAIIEPGSWSDAGVLNCLIIDPGSGYTSVPTLTVTGRPGSSGSTLIAEIAYGKIISVDFVNVGTGYAPTATYNGGVSIGNTFNITLNPNGSYLYSVYSLSRGDSLDLAGRMPTKYYTLKRPREDFLHGTHVASIIAGKKNGWLKKAKIYNMRLGTDSIGVTDSFRLLKAIHSRKPIDPVLGTQRPTVINGSWSAALPGIIPQKYVSTPGLDPTTDTVYADSASGYQISGFEYRGTLLDNRFFMDHSLGADGKNRTIEINGGWGTEPSTVPQNRAGITSTVYNVGYGDGTNESYDAVLTDLFVGTSGIFYTKSAGNTSRRQVRPTDPDVNNKMFFYIKDENDNPIKFSLGWININAPASPNDANGSDIRVGSLGILPYYGTQDERSVYSSYGESVDIYATGTFIAAAEGSLNSNIRSDYIFFSGTSMAAPQVAGVVGLYVSRFIELYRVAPTAQQVKNAMIDAEVPFEGSTLIGWAKTGSLYDPETLAGPASLGRAASGIIQNKILYWPYGTAATITTKTYTLSNNATNGFINEGNTVTFTLNTNNVPAGTTVGYTITGVSASDIDKELTGSFTLTSTGGTTCQATLAILIKADAATEGSETLTLTLTGRTESSSVIIQDSSTAPATTNTVYSLSSSVQTAVEGNYLTITLRTNTATENTTVTRYADVPYGSAPLQKADIYIPNGTVDGVVYYIHGGGWSGGTKNDLVAFSESLSLRGYAVVNVDYRLVGTAGGGNDDGQYPNNMNDVATAIDFGTRNTNTDSFSIHWAKVRNLIVTQNLPWVVCGDSAGGHLAILGTIKNGITNNVWPDAVWNSAGPSDLEFIDQYNDEILPLVYQDIITPYATTLTNQRNASPGYLYGSTSTPGTYKTQIDNAPTKFYFVTNLNDNLVSSESTLRFAYNLPDNRRTVFVIEQKSWLTTLEPPPNNTRKSAGGISHYYISNTLDVLSHNLPMIFGMYRNKFYSVTGVAAAYGLNNAVSVASHVLNANASDIIRFDVRLLHGNVATPTKVYWSINPSSTVSLSNFTDYPYNANDRFCLVSNYKPGYFTLKVNPSFTTYGILIIDVYEDAARTLKLGTSYRTYINPAAYSAPALTAGLCRTRYNGLLTNITQAGISALTVANQTIDTNTIDLGFSGTNYTINWSGFFIPDTTELYTFYADGVDDAFYLWIGVDAGSGFTNENSLISQTVIGQNSQANVYLHSGYRYIIRMIYLQNTSSETATISYSTPTIAKTTNFANRIYHISCP